MPLGIKEIKVINKDRSKTDPKKAALRLLKFDEELYSDSHRSKRKRKKNEQSHENSINESQENVTDESITLESNKELNKKKRVNHDLKYSLHESNETIESCLKDLKMTKVPALIIDRSKNKQKKRDQIESGILKHKKNGIGTVVSNKVNKQKVMKTKSTLFYAKNTTKNIIVHKFKKLKNNMRGQWDVSDNVPPISWTPICSNDNENKINNVCNAELNTSISRHTNDVTIDKQTEWLRPTLKKSIVSFLKDKVN